MDGIGERRDEHVQRDLGLQGWSGGATRDFIQALHVLEAEYGYRLYEPFEDSE